MKKIIHRGKRPEVGLWKHFTTPYSIPFLSVLHQNKAFRNFHKSRQRPIAGRIKGLVNITGSGSGTVIATVEVWASKKWEITKEELTLNNKPIRSFDYENLLCFFISWHIIHFSSFLAMGFFLNPSLRSPLPKEKINK